MKNQRDMLRNMQNQMVKIQEALEHEMVESTAGGAIKVVMNGHQVMQSIVIDPAAVDPEDVEMLQDLIIAAVNDALNKSKELAAQRLSVLTGGIKIPGL